jgi:hypothetical protein
VGQAPLQAERLPSSVLRPLFSRSFGGSDRARIWYNNEDVNADSPRRAGIGTGTTHGGGHRIGRAFRNSLFGIFQLRCDPGPQAGDRKTGPGCVRTVAGWSLSGVCWAARQRAGSRCEAYAPDFGRGFAGPASSLAGKERSRAGTHDPRSGRGRPGEEQRRRLPAPGTPRKTGLSGKKIVIETGLSGTYSRNDYRNCTD